MGEQYAAQNEPWQRAETWQSLAIAAAIITPVCGIFTLPWIFAAASDHTMLQRVQIVAAAMTVGIAIVTFCTIVWRGLISTQQAKLQREQLDRLSEQISETSKNSLAALLQKGAELVSEAEKPAHVSAGLATLHSVGSDTNDKFSIQAMNLIAEYIQDFGRRSHESAKVKIAIEYLDAINRETGRQATMRLRFEADQTQRSRWMYVTGVDDASYRGGEITAQELNYRGRGGLSVRFHEVRIQRCVIDTRPGLTFAHCDFVGCEIKEINGYSLMRNTFRNCDFSGANFRGIANLQDLREHDNWFDPERPPTIRGKQAPDVDWPSVFHSGRPSRMRMSEAQEPIPIRRANQRSPDPNTATE